MIIIRARSGRRAAAATVAGLLFCYISFRNLAEQLKQPSPRLYMYLHTHIYIYIYIYIYIHVISMYVYIYIYY